MRIRMLETFQSTTETALDVHEGIRVSILEKGEEYEADAALAAYLLMHHKGEQVKAKPARKKVAAEPSAPAAEAPQRAQAKGR